MWLLDYLPIIRHEEINCVWHCRVCQTFINYIRQTHISVCDESVEIQIPDPVVLSSLDYAFNHVKFEPCGASRRIRFIINMKIITMQSSIIYNDTNKVSDLSLKILSLFSKHTLEIRFSYNFCFLNRDEGRSAGS